MNLRLIIRFIIVATVTWVLLTMFMGCTLDVENVDKPFESDICENSLGNVACNFTMIDQNGNQVDLYSFHGKIIILDLSAMWCGPCQYAALDTENTVKKYGAENIVYITVLIENTSGQPPSLQDLTKWSETFGIVDSPVLAGSRQWLNDSGYALSGWPTFYFISEDMIITEYQRGYGKINVDRAIEDLLAAQ